MSGQIPGVSAPPPVPGLAPSPSLSSSSFADGTPKKASIWPLVVCSVLLLTSLAIRVFDYQLGGGNWYFLGYLLTPVLTSLALGWDAILQRNGRKNPWFVPSSLFSTLIRIEVGLSFALGVSHILEIGKMCGQSFVQSGALCV